MKLFISILFLSSFLHANVIINEIMFNPSGNDDFEWIEIYNSNSNSISLDGWKLKNGIKFSFDSQHEIAGNGYLVLARNTSDFSFAYPHVKCAGNFKGKLSNKGEKITLVNSSGILVDSVTYDVDDTWPKITFNGGASLERIAAESPADSMADWLPSHNSSAWYLIETTLKIKRPIIKLATILKGNYTIDDFKITSINETNNLFPNGDFESGIPLIKVSSSYIAELTEKSHSGHYALQIQSTKNVGRIQLKLPNVFDKNSKYKLSFWIKIDGKINNLKLFVPGNKSEIIELDRERKFGGTPGTANSNAKRIPGPEISSLKHFPFFPQPDSQIIVKTILGSEDTNASVKLFYKKGLIGDFVSVSMQADITNKLCFSADIPALSKNEYYDYYVIAEMNNHFTRYPCEFDSPSTKRCYSLEIKNAPEIPVIAFWLNERKPGKRNFVSRNRYKLCDVAIKNKIYHGVKVRYRGAHSFRHGIKKAYNLKFGKWMRPDLFEKGEYESAAVLNAMAFDYSFMREKLSFELFRREGVPASDNFYVRGYKNGSLRGLFLLTERVNGDFLEKKNLNENGVIISPQNRKGFKPKACKIIYEADEVNGLALLKKLYKDLVPIPKRNIAELTIRKNNLLTNFFINKLMDFTAVNVIIQKHDGIVANFYAYCDANQEKWEMIPWDHDFTWGLSINGFHLNDNSISPFYGSRAHKQAVRNYVSPINDALFWPEIGTGAEITQDFRTQYLNTLTNIITEQLSSGKLENFVDTIVTSIQYEAELEIKMRHPRANSKATFETAINNLKSSMNSREEYLLRESKKLMSE